LSSRDADADGDADATSTLSDGDTESGDACYGGSVGCSDAEDDIRGDTLPESDTESDGGRSQHSVESFSHVYPAHNRVPFLAASSTQSTAGQLLD
jgi:hypothetical protein